MNEEIAGTDVSHLWTLGCLLCDPCLMRECETYLPRSRRWPGTHRVSLSIWMKSPDLPVDIQSCWNSLPVVCHYDVIVGKVSEKDSSGALCEFTLLLVGI